MSKINDKNQKIFKKLINDHFAEQERNNLLAQLVYAFNVGYHQCQTDMAHANAKNSKLIFK